MHSFLRKHSAPCIEERRKYNRDFAVSTSFHGVHHLVHGNNTGTRDQIRRVLWLVVVLVFVFVAFSQVCSRIVNYFTWPTTTSVTVQYVGKIEFPSITFCNLNRFQTSAVNNLSIAFFMWNIVSTVLNFSNAGKDSKDIQEINEFLQLNQNFSIKDFTKNYGFYLNNSTLLKCDFFGSPCYPEDFEHVFTEYGNCYTFNHNTPESNKRINTVGKGLSVLFDIKQTEFTDDPTLGFVDAGITFVIHSPKIPPRFNGLGLHSPVGMHAHASIRLAKVLERNVTFRSFYNCVYPALHKIEKLELCSVGTYNSSCPVPCEENDYPATLSYSTFPSDKAADFLSNKLSKNTTYMRNNLVYIDIKYSELNYKISKQQKAMTSSALLSDVGGQLGLFCGASMITVIEVLEFVLTNVLWACAFMLLKIPNISQWADNQSRYKEEIRDC